MRSSRRLRQADHGAVLGIADRVAQRDLQRLDRAERDAEDHAELRDQLSQGRRRGRPALGGGWNASGKAGRAPTSAVNNTYKARTYTAFKSTADRLPSSSLRTS